MTDVADERAESGAAWPHERVVAATSLAKALGLPSPTTAQQSVIEAPPGPAIVVAGAGSGKTETMAARVVWLVANGYVQAHEVLGLTFTRKAASELGERVTARLHALRSITLLGLVPHLDRIVGDDLVPQHDSATEREAAWVALSTRFVPDLPPLSARDEWGEQAIDVPRISTYNAFADGIVRDHAARIGLEPDASLLSPAAAWLMARRVLMTANARGIDELDQAFSTVVDGVLNLHHALLDHGASSGEVAKFADGVIKRLSAVADLGRATPRAAERALTRVLALPTMLELAEAFADAKRVRGVREYADQVATAMQIVLASAEVSALLRDEYRIVLLDEYQDTSVRQTELFAKIFADTSVMAVGDPHQSIYGWRGASADNLDAFGRAFARDGTVRRFSLMTSWRNDERILDVARAVLKPLAHGVTVEPLGPRPGAGPGAVEISFTESVTDEAEAVAAWFAAAMRPDHGQEHAAERSGAILFRARRHMTTFAEALTRHGVPHRVLGFGGLLSEPEVVDIVSVIRVLADAGAGSALIRLLAGPRFAVGVADLKALHEFAKTLSERDGTLRLLDEEVRAVLRRRGGVDEATSLIDAVDVLSRLRDDHRLLSGISAVGRERLREAAAMLARLRVAATGQISALVRMIETELHLDIELPAHEGRGPAHFARAQVRAFSDEVRGYLDADDRGTLTSLVAWLDRAEKQDDLAARTEAAEPGLVQLLTVHGSKGLEWDRVAVVRMVADEFPKPSKSVQGWLGFAQLPYRFRGDRAALPEIDWPAIDADAKAVESAISAFADRVRQHAFREERRLAYVAVTRARTELLLTGSFWGGQARVREPGAYLVEAAEVIGITLPQEPAGDNPYGSAGAGVAWPLDPLGARRVGVTHAASLVQAAIERGDTEPSAPLARLLKEHEARRSPARVATPSRLSASQMKRFLHDFGEAAGDIARPMPERPLRRSRLGTRFHEWVERRYGMATGAFAADDPLWEVDRDLEDAALADENVRLEELARAFEQLPWASRSPRSVEEEIDFLLPGLDGRDASIIVCKLDAVFDAGDGRIEIVDWKTGSTPGGAADRDERLLQVGLYRLAYHERYGVPLDMIDVALVYLGDGSVIREPHVLTFDEVRQLWHDARERARPAS